MLGYQDRANSVLNDLENDDLTMIAISDIELISKDIDPYDAMALNRSFGAAWFTAKTKGIPKKAKEAAFLDLKGRLTRLL